MTPSRNARGAGITPYAPYDEHFDRVHSTIKKLQQKYTPAKILQEGRLEAQQLGGSVSEKQMVSGERSILLKKPSGSVGSRAVAAYQSYANEEDVGTTPGASKLPTGIHKEAAAAEERSKEELLEKITRRRIGGQLLDPVPSAAPFTPTKLRSLNTVGSNKHAPGSKAQMSIRDSLTADAYGEGRSTSQLAGTAGTVRKNQRMGSGLVPQDQTASKASFGLGAAGSATRQSNLLSSAAKGSVAAKHERISNLLATPSASATLNNERIKLVSTRIDPARFGRASAKLG